LVADSVAGDEVRKRGRNALVPGLNHGRERGEIKAQNDACDCWHKRAQLPVSRAGRREQRLTNLAEAAESYLVDNELDDSDEDEG
jgi:hypothetical protein